MMPEEEEEEKKGHILETIDPVLLGSRLRKARHAAAMSYYAARLTLEERGQWVPGMRLSDLEAGSYVPMHRGLSGFLIALAALYECQVADFVGPEKPGTPEEVWECYTLGEISEGRAARWLGIDRLELRAQAEERARR